MLRSLRLHHYGPLAKIDWRPLGSINLVIGGNGSGKTFLLKAIYSAMRTIEEHRRGDDQRSAAEILADKLYWTFQAEKIGDLVTKGAASPLKLELDLDGHRFGYSFGKDTSKAISAIENDVPPRKSNSIFLPAKEVLSLHHIILKSREEDKVFGFDDTYLDLARALRPSPKAGKNYLEFAASRRSLEDIVGGRVEYEDASGRWSFKKGNQKFPIGVTAEGVKKIGILDTLLGNRFLDPHSIVIIDEPESALHPSAIVKLLEIVAVLASRGMQFFLASHSYFVVKKLCLIAKEQGISIPVCSFVDGRWRTDDLRAGMPDNPIVDESIRLYEQEVDMALK